MLGLSLELAHRQKRMETADPFAARPGPQTSAGAPPGPRLALGGTMVQEPLDRSHKETLRWQQREKGAKVGGGGCSHLSHTFQLGQRFQKRGPLWDWS